MFIYLARKTHQTVGSGTWQSKSETSVALHGSKYQPFKGQPNQMFKLYFFVLNCSFRATE